MRRLALALLGLFVSLSATAMAQETASDPVASAADSLVAVSLKDGTRLQGRIVGSDERSITIMTIGGIEVKAPRSSVASIEPLRGRMVRGQFRRQDPNYTRLLFTPTGRPLRRGEGYFSDVWVLFPNVAYGITGNLTVLVGSSMIPGVGIGDQLKYVAPRFGVSLGRDVAVAVGTLYGNAHSQGGGVAYATGTVGPPDRSVTAAFGVPYVGTSDFKGVAIIVLGGNVRMTNSLALVTENWLFFGTGSEKGSSQAYSLALRFFGDRLSGDFGALFNKDVLEAGFPVPWLSLTYHFGK